MTVHENIGAVLAAMRRAMVLIEQGMADFNAGGDRRYAGLTTAITTARSMSNIAQNVKHFDPEFEPWWRGIIGGLYDNDVAKWFVDVRNLIEKQGTVGAMAAGLNIDLLDPARLMQGAPPGAVGFFLADSLGRSGWTVRLADGTVIPVYFEIPESIGRATLSAAGAPGDRSFDELLPLYVDMQSRLLDLMIERYGE